MMKFIKTGWLLQFSGLIFLFMISGCGSANEDGEAQISEANNRQTVFGELNPGAPIETAQWGQLAGEWKCISRDLDERDPENPQWYSNKATWIWRYVLGGNAVLNEWWQEDTSPNPLTGEYFATGLFIFNPQSSLWEVVVVNSRARRISPKFQAEYKDGEIRMHDGSGKWLVTFFDITTDAFEWKYERMTGSGEWKPISEISARRKT